MPNNYFDKAREFLKTLNYPTLDATTPLSRHMQDDLNSTSEYFAINFISYLIKVGVLNNSKKGLELNLVDLDGLEFDLYRCHLERCAREVNPLRRLLQES